MYSMAQLNSLPLLLALTGEMIVIEHWDLVCEDVETDYLMIAVALVDFELVPLAVWQVTLLVSVTFAGEDEVTFEVLDSFVVIIEEKVHDIVDYFQVVVVVWQVLVWNSVSKLVLAVVRQLEFQPIDFHNLATYYVPFDEASKQDYVPVLVADESVDQPAAAAVVVEHLM